MSIIAGGRLFSFVWAIGILLVLAYYYRRGFQGIVATIKRLPALDSIDEAVGKCAETNRPVFTTVGRGTFQGVDAMVSLAGIEVVTYASKLCARKGVREIFSCGDATVLSVAEERIKEAYVAENYQGSIEDNVKFSFAPGMAWNLDTYQKIGDEKVGAFIWIGRFGNETVILGEAATIAGAMQIAGSDSLTVVAFQVASADYTLIGEELYSAGAYLSKDPVQTNVIAASDFIKIVLLGFLILIEVVNNFNTEIMKLFSM